MKVTYVEHSSFLVELEHCCLLFDYFQGEIPALDGEKELYVFVSHRHGDHFSPVVFELAKTYPKVQYVISDDIWQKRMQFVGWRVVQGIAGAGGIVWTDCVYGTRGRKEDRAGFGEDISVYG